MFWRLGCTYCIRSMANRRIAVSLELWRPNDLQQEWDAGFFHNISSSDMVWLFECSVGLFFCLKHPWTVFLLQELFQKLDVDQSGWHGCKSIRFVIITFALMSQPLATIKTNHSSTPPIFFGSLVLKEPFCRWASWSYWWRGVDLRQLWQLSRSFPSNKWQTISMSSTRLIRTVWLDDFWNC